MCGPPIAARRGHASPPREGSQPRVSSRSLASRGAARSVWPGGGEACHSRRPQGELTAHDHERDSHTGAHRGGGGARADHRRGAAALRAGARGRDRDPARHHAGALRAQFGQAEHHRHRAVRLRTHVSDVPGRHGARGDDDAPRAPGARRRILGSLAPLRVGRRARAPLHRSRSRPRRRGAVPDDDGPRDPVADPARRRRAADEAGAVGPVGGGHRRVRSDRGGGRLADEPRPPADLPAPRPLRRPWPSSPRSWRCRSIHPASSR